MSKHWRRCFFQWAAYLALVGCLPAFGLIWLIARRPPAASTIAVSALLVIMFSAQEARKGTSPRKSR